MNVSILKSMDACIDAVTWAKKQPDVYSAWEDCRADRLLWLAIRLGVDIKLVVAACCDCVETVLRFVSNGENRPRLAIEITRKWIDGKVTIKEMKKISNAVGIINTIDNDKKTYYVATAAYYSIVTAINSEYDDSLRTAALNADGAAFYAAYDIDGFNIENLVRLNPLIRKRIPYQIMKQKWDDYSQLTVEEKGDDK